MEIIIQTAGWIGTILIVLAYFLVSYQYVLPNEDKIYQLMNLLGAIGIGINVFHQHAWPVLVLEIVWASIAIVSLIRPK